MGWQSPSQEHEDEQEQGKPPGQRTLLEVMKTKCAVLNNPGQSASPGGGMAWGGAEDIKCLPATVTASALAEGHFKWNNETTFAC